MWIPEPVYQALPPIYSVAGVATIAYSLSVVNVLSGMLLISAGGIVWWQRRDARKKLVSKRRRVATGKMKVKL